MLGVYRNEIDILVSLVPKLLSKQPPLEALHDWCQRLVEVGKVKYGIADIIHATSTAKDVQDICGPLLGAVRQLLQACENAGSIGTGTDPQDFLVLLGLLWRIPPDEAGEAQVQRLLALILRGLGTENMPT